MTILYSKSVTSISPGPPSGFFLYLEGTSSIHLQLIHPKVQPHMPAHLGRPHNLLSLTHSPLWNRVGQTSSPWASVILLLGDGQLRSCSPQGDSKTDPPTHTKMSRQSSPQNWGQPRGRDTTARRQVWHLAQQAMGVSYRPATTGSSRFLLFPNGGLH